MSFHAQASYKQKKTNRKFMWENEAKLFIEMDTNVFHLSTAI
jgi:hypothetical protein